MDEKKQMRSLHFATVAVAWTVLVAALTLASNEKQLSAAQPSRHEHGSHGDHGSPKKALEAAEGARVKILSPKKGQVVRGDTVPLIFELTKGKRGHHVHAYIDGHLMGMFQSEKGSLSGVEPGHHVLELRVVADDHQTELNATDSVDFVTR